MSSVDLYYDATKRGSAFIVWQAFDQSETGIRNCWTDDKEISECHVEHSWVNRKHFAFLFWFSLAISLTIFDNVCPEQRHWDWSISDINLRWDCRLSLDDGSPMCVCYNARSSDQVATFVPPPLDATPPGPAAVLTVFPDGWEWFDEILISALVVERKRGLEV